MIDFIKKHSTITIIFLFVISICLMYFTNQYDILSKNLELINNGNIEQKTILYLSNQTLFFNILGIVVLNIAVALFISSFFLRYIEKSEKESFYNKLQEFQKETAKDAIKATFERVMDNDLFSIIEQDILNANFLRRNVQWDFDIYENDEKKLELKRTLTYNLKNITTKDQEETFSISSNNNSIHSTIKSIECKYKSNNDHEYKSLEFPQNNENSSFEAGNKIEVRANEEVQVVIVFVEVFTNNYIYEAHSTRFPIVGLNLTVNYPKEYEFEVIVQTFSNKLEVTSSSDGKKKFETKKAIYKGQGMEFLCYKKGESK